MVIKKGFIKCSGCNMIYKLPAKGKCKFCGSNIVKTEKKKKLSKIKK